jgi:hypothetical protein
MQRKAIINGFLTIKGESSVDGMGIMSFWLIGKMMEKKLETLQIVQARYVHAHKIQIFILNNL